MKLLLEFENAGLASAVGRAARVAPTKGVAYDTSAGIAFDIRPDDPDYPFAVKATNIEVTYMEQMAPLRLEHDLDAGGQAVLRFPSVLLAGFIGGLPIGSGKKVLFQLDTEESPLVSISSGRTKANINLLPGAFFDWEPFDPALVADVVGFANRIGQATWATNPDFVPLSGLHFDGKSLYATDRYQMVRVPCDIPHLASPVSVPLEKLAAVLGSPDGDGLVAIGATDRKLLMMPDEHTQVTSTVYDLPYPNVWKAMTKEQPCVMKVERQPLRDAINRMCSLVGRGERYPTMFMRIYGGSTGAVKLGMRVDGVGDMTDQVDMVAWERLSGSHDDDEGCDVRMTPTYLTAALDHARGNTVSIAYDPEHVNKAMRVEDDDDYEVWIMPKTGRSPSPRKTEEE